MQTLTLIDGPPVTEKEEEQTAEGVRNELRPIIGPMPVLRIYIPDQLMELERYFWDLGIGHHKVRERYRRLERRANKRLKRRKRLPDSFRHEFAWFENEYVCACISYPIKGTPGDPYFGEPSPPNTKLRERLKEVVDDVVYVDGWNHFGLSSSRIGCGKYPAALLLLLTPWCVIMLVRPQRLIVLAEFIGEGFVRPHCEDGPALITADGKEHYYLYGEQVPKRVVMKPEKISQRDFRRLLRIRNVNTRARILARLPFQTILRICKAQKVDSWQGYTLYVTGRVLSANCLLMQNPTTGMMHLEWVPKGVWTVRQALEFRNGRPGFPVVLT